MSQPHSILSNSPAPGLDAVVPNGIKHGLRAFEFRLHQTCTFLSKILKNSAKMSISNMDAKGKPWRDPKHCP
jgi:hypothetical protein